MVAAEFRRVVEVNLVGSFNVARAAIRHLPPGATLTFLSSQAGLKGGAAGPRMPRRRRGSTGWWIALRKRWLTGAFA